MPNRPVNADVGPLEMAAPLSSASQEANHRHQVGVVLALAGGAAAYYVPKFIAMTFAIESPLLFDGSLAATMCLPLVLGFAYPRQPWQWGLLVLVGQLVFMLAIEGLGDMAQFPIGVALYAVLLIPVVLFGILGAYLSRVFRRYSSTS
jgi:hypothetical protein